MGLSFLALLYLQASYFEEVLLMRKEQFDESVSRSLHQASRRLELDETWQALESEIRKSASGADYGGGGFGLPGVAASLSRRSVRLRA